MLPIIYHSLGSIAGGSLVGFIFWIGGVLGGISSNVNVIIIGGFSGLVGSLVYLRNQSFIP